MDTGQTQLKQRLNGICREWLTRGLPSRDGLIGTADALVQWKKDRRIDGIWSRRPLMLTATLDDGLGQGLDIIERYADVIGLKIRRLGLLLDPDHIINQCRQFKPEFLGLTVLQLDSDDDLVTVGQNLPSRTRLIAGGPVFRFDPDMAQRCRVDHVAPNVAYFIEYLTKWPCL